MTPSSARPSTPPGRPELVEARERRLAWIAWAAVCVIWGTTYLGIRISLETMPPMVMAGLRWTVAGGFLAAYMTSRGERLPRPADWASPALLGFLMLVLGNGCLVWAELYVPSGLAAVLVASSPFWMAGVEALWPDGERMTRRTAAGLVLGFLGIVVLIWPALAQGGTAGRGFVLGVIALQIACMGWSLGSSYSKRHGRSQNVFSATAAQMLAGGVMLLVLGTIRGEWAALGFSTRSAVAFGYLTTIGAIGGFVAYTYALRHLPVSLVSLYAYINPIIAVALGVAVLGEPFTSRMALAAAFVFGGVAIVRTSRASAQARTHVTPFEFRPDAR
jgi:drug/metabolite transporter (DMT)-like permease